MLALLIHQYMLYMTPVPAPLVPEPMVGEGLGRAWGGLCSRALAEELKQSPPSCCAGAGRAPLLVPAGRRTHLSGDNGLIVQWILMKLPGSAAECLCVEVLKL